MKTQSQEEICLRIISTIAEMEEVSFSDLSPLGDTIDIEALQAFLESSSGTAKAEFQYMGRRIKLEADGKITISEPDPEQERYVARCNTCREERRDVNLETAQDFFAIHVDQGHAGEINRTGRVEPDPSTSTFGSETGQAEGTD